MDEPRTDAPDFELSTTPTDSSDALQLDPSDSLAGFEIAPATPKVPSKPAKKPTVRDNDAVIAAILGKPLAAKTKAPATADVAAVNVEPEEKKITLETIAVEKPVVATTAIEPATLEKPVAEKSVVPKPATLDSILGAMLGKPIAAAPTSTTPIVLPAITSLSGVVLSDVAATPATPVVSESPPVREPIVAAAKTENVSATVTEPETPSFVEEYVIPEPPIELPPLRLTYSEADYPPLDVDAELEELDLPPLTLKLPITFTPPSEQNAVDDSYDDAEADVVVESEAIESQPIEPQRVEAEIPVTEVLDARVDDIVVAAKPVDIAEHLQSAFAMDLDDASDASPNDESTDEPEAALEDIAEYHVQGKSDLPREKTGAWWTLPLMFAGIAIVACAVLVPATDENRRAMYELAKIDRDVTYFQKQSDVNKDFLTRVSNDPTLAERLALRQLHMTLADTHLVKLPTKTEAFNRSPFALVSVEPPPQLEPYHTVAGVLGDWFLDIRRQIYLAGIGLLMAAAGVIFGGGEPTEERRPSTVEI